MLATLPQIPSYAQGFARRRGESRQTGVWDGLVGLWGPLLGPAGLTLPNWSPQGPGLAGTLMNMDPGADWTASPYGWTLNFADVSDHVLVPYAPVLGPPQISVRAIYRSPASFNAANVIVSKGDPATTRVDYDLYFNASRHLSARFYDGNWRNHWVWFAVEPDTWYDVVFSFDGQRAKVWIDGQLRLDEPETNPRPQTSGSLYLGNYSLSQTQSFRGRLALVAIWDRVLTSSEVQQLYVDRWAPLGLSRRVRARLPGVGGPYRLAAAGSFQAGAAAGEVFSTGSVAGESDGHSG
jgi:Concanavalin A-like lectin/glucanases superfamily